MSVRGRQRWIQEELRCSFCRKSQVTVGKLISNPSDYPRAYICDECIAVCNSIIEDDRHEAQMQEQAEHAGGFLQHPLAPELLDAVECWAAKDLSGLPASEELNQVRTVAARMFAELNKPESE